MRSRQGCTGSISRRVPREVVGYHGAHNGGGGALSNDGEQGDNGAQGDDGAHGDDGALDDDRAREEVAALAPTKPSRRLPRLRSPPPTGSSLHNRRGVKVWSVPLRDRPCGPLAAQLLGRRSLPSPPLDIFVGYMVRQHGPIDSAIDSSHPDRQDNDAQVVVLEHDEAQSLCRCGKSILVSIGPQLLVNSHNTSARSGSRA
jgi:hypothetical protein